MMGLHRFVHVARQPGSQRASHRKSRSSRYAGTSRYATFLHKEAVRLNHTKNDMALLSQTDC